MESLIICTGIPVLAVTLAPKVIGPENDLYADRSETVGDRVHGACSCS